MSGYADCLIEIGTEELPPKALRSLSEAFAQGVSKGIADAKLDSGATEAFATPRRLALLVHDLQLEQAEQQIEKRGPPVRIAFDEQGQPSRAAVAFAKGFSLRVEDLDRLKTPKGEWLIYRGRQAGQAAIDLLPEIVATALAKLPIPKRMRWGSGDTEFVRPVHWVVLMLGSETVNAEIMGHRASNSTHGHRYHAPHAIELKNASGYVESLTSAGHVLPHFATRQARVAELVHAAAADLGGKAVVEASVLEEVTALVEWPVPVCGRFDKEFLRLPEEILIATLQDHQRYFPVRGKDGKLMAHFITISNLDSREPEQVSRGNERVVHPRLADASFFWQQDLQQSLAERREKLRQVVFQKDLGSLFDKSNRVADLCRALSQNPNFNTPDNNPEKLTQAVVRAAELAKADLLTQMVGEYPELQGRVGYYYALEDGEDKTIAAAIDEHYLPRHAGDRLPSITAGQILSLADRLDTLTGIFAAGKRPTGNKDPFGLRRSALGLVRILVESNIELDLPHYIGSALAAQPISIAQEQDLAAEIFEFINDRLRAYYMDGQAPGCESERISAEMLAAVRARSPASPLDFHRRLIALQQFLTLPEAESLAQANKRIANILRGATEDKRTETSTALFVEKAESNLYQAMTNIADAHGKRKKVGDYAGILSALATLREPVDTFFDDVMVMSDDPRQRANRLALLRELQALFLDVADLSVLPSP